MSTSTQSQGGFAELVEFHSEWIGDSWMRVAAKKIGKGTERKKLSITVTEMTQTQTSKKRAAKVACEAARRLGVPSVDYVLLHDHETSRETRTIEDVTMKTNIRNSVFVFGV